MVVYIEGVDREQATPFPQLLDDWVDEDHLVRVDDLCGNELDLASLGFDLVLRLGLAAQCITRQWC